MPVLVLCAGCKKKLRIADTLIGKTIKCPNCARKILLKVKTEGPAPALSAAQPNAPPKKVAATVTSKTATRPAPVEPNTAPVAKTPPAPARPAAKPSAKAAVPPPPPPPVNKPAPITAPKSPAKSKTAERDGPNRALIGGIAAAVLLLAAVFWFFMGGSSEGHVSGTVTLEGEPLASAQVVFIGEDEKNRAPLMAPTDEDGSYKLVGHKGGGIAAGKYKVVVTKMALKDGTIPEGPKLQEARSKDLLLNVLPKVYEDRSTTPLSFEVRPGGNKIDLVLKKRL